MDNDFMMMLIISIVFWLNLAFYGGLKEQQQEYLQKLQDYIDLKKEEFRSCLQQQD